MRWLKTIIVLAPYLLVFFASLYNPTDPDLGWHLRYGEYIYNYHQIPEQNIFSAEMRDFKWVYHTWLTDFLAYLVFAKFSFFGLTILSALIITLTFFFLTKSYKLTLWDQALIFPIILYLESPLNSISFRSQQVSLMFISLLIFTLSLYEKFKLKTLLFIIPMFALWANIHGEFLLGLSIVILWIALKLFSDYFFAEDRHSLQIFKEAKILFLILLGSFVATLLNPFGIKIYLEALHHFSNPYQRYIAEWLPFEDLSLMWWNHIILGFFLFYSSVFLFFSGQIKNRLSGMGITLVLYSFSLIIRRYAWPTYYLTIPIIQPTSSFLKPSNKKIYLASLILTFALSFFIVWQKKYPFTQFTNMDWAKYCQQRYCSDQSAKFIVDNKLNNDKLLTFYDWGGWLIWNYPQIKPSIDGRMSFWIDDGGFSAIAYYFPFEQNWQDIDNSKYDVVLMSPYKPVYNHLLQLVQKGKWELLYQDQFAGVFKRKLL